MARSVVETLQLAATMTVILPVVYLGVDFLISGRTLLGAGFLAVAGLMLALEEYVVRPGDVPLEAAKRAAGLVAKDDDGE
ncbi:MAG TPA: hypothetical protein VJ898_13560 [Natrialbaceae archaeon]|nr:hypothetical protein [Natrialbaceae archaeon]